MPTEEALMARRSSRNANGSDARSVPARAHRFSDEQRQTALELIVGGMKRCDVATSVDCTTETLRRWYKAANKAGTLPRRDTAASAQTPSAATAVTPAPATEAAASSAPHDPGSGLGAHEVRTILEYKAKHPSMGPAQIRAQLKRFFKWRVSVRAIARVLRQAGYPPVHRGGRPVGDEHPGRFEAPHRNALWQLDFTELRIGPHVRWLLVIEDDFSRFIVGHRLTDTATSEVVVATLREAIGLHGKPERIYTDRGAAFTAWRDVTACETFLDAELIDHSLRAAHRPQGGGKIESVIAT
jgi:transposase